MPERRMRRTEQPPPLDALWQAPVIIWAILAGQGLAAVLALAPGSSDNRWVYFGITSLVVQWVSLTTLGALYLFRRALAHLRPTLVAYAALGALVCVTALVCSAGWLLLRDLWPLARDGWMPMFLRLTAMALVVGLLGLAAFYNHWRATQLAVRAKQSELEALQARIQPHFLFNTLNTGIALLHQRPSEAERLLLDLSDLFRAALAGPREIALAEELALARRYLEIEGLRFGPRLQVRWQIPDELPEITVPALSVQPLVENAIRHGVEPSAAGGAIDISIGRQGRMLRIAVGNDLPATPARATNGHRIGLSSVRARILAMTGGLGSVETVEADGRYTATIHLPLDS